MSNSRLKTQRRKAPERPRHAPPFVFDPARLLAASVSVRWRVYGDQLRLCRRRPSEKSIHDLRVAARRLIAVLDAVARMIPDDRLRKARRSLRKQLKAFNTLRDTHVQLMRARSMVRALPALRPFIAMLASRERALVRQASKHLAMVPTDHMEQWLAGADAALTALFARPSMQSAGREALLGSAASAFTAAVLRREAVSATDPRAIHRLRIAFKKTRYTIEALEPLLPWATRGMLKAMNRYQTRMGEIQDLEVLTASIRAFARRRRPGAPGSFLAVYQRLARERMERTEEFLRSADELYGFWREPGSGRLYNREIRS